MTSKEALIISIIKKELKSIEKLLKMQDEEIENIRKNGFDKEIHPKNRESISTGLSYTQGYCTGHKCLAERVLSLLNASESYIYKEIEEDEIVSKKNKAEMKRVFSKIKISAKKKINDNKKKGKA
jgi:hypothetical protein